MTKQQGETLSVHINPRRRMMGVGALGMLATMMAAWGASIAAGQQSTPSPVSAPESVLLASTEKYLWAARVEAEDGVYTTDIVARERISEFKRIKKLNGAVKFMAARGEELFAVFADNTVYRLFIDGSGVSERGLPEGAAPVALAASANGLYALVASAVAAAVSPPAGADPETDQDRFDPKSSRLSLILYGKTGWRPLMPCPDEVSDATSPALGTIGDDVLLFWLPADEAGIRSARFQAGTAEWKRGPDNAIESPITYWPAMMDRIISVAAVSGGKLQLCRRLGEEWSRDTLRFLDNAPDPGKEDIQQAAAFNQHVAFVVRDSSGARQLRFGRIDEEPSEPTLSMADIFEQPAPGTNLRFHTLMFFILIATFAALWIFRRGSMVAPVALPAGWQLAFVSQRGAAWLIDLIPFTVAYAMILGVDWSSGIGELFKWAIDIDSTAGTLSQPNVLKWWILSGSSYLLYAVSMELVSRRTIGKIVMRLHLLNEAGERPSAAQIVARNAFRVLELTPPLWALNFLAVLTRNRQRLGDIFARTVVVRRASGVDPASDSPASTDADSADNDDQPPATPS